MLHLNFPTNFLAVPAGLLDLPGEGVHTLPHDPVLGAVAGAGAGPAPSPQVVAVRGGGGRRCYQTGDIRLGLGSLAGSGVQETAAGQLLHGEVDVGAGGGGGLPAVYSCVPQPVWPEHLWLEGHVGAGGVPAQLGVGVGPLLLIPRLPAGVLLQQIPQVRLVSAVQRVGSCSALSPPLNL